jgi:hypothetical protein
MGKHARPDDTDDGWIWTGHSWRYAPLAAETAAASAPQPASFAWPVPRPAPIAAPAGGSGLPPHVGFAATSAADPDPWRRLRVWWNERTVNDRRILIVVAALTAVIVTIGLTAGHSSSTSSSSSSSSTSWDSDLGPTDLQTSEYTYYLGDRFDVPTPSYSQARQYMSDTGQSGYTGGLVACQLVRYGAQSPDSAASYLAGAASTDIATGRETVRAGLLDLCPA